jgi:hypothetical protein
MLKLSLPSDVSEVSSAFSLLLHSWHDKVPSPFKIFSAAHHFQSGQTKKVFFVEWSSGASFTGSL